MKIWLIREGEALPIMQNVRLMRMGMLAKYLSEQGHDVTWWASTYIHGEKRYFCENYQEINVNEKEKLILLHSPVVYKKNVSFARLRYNARLSREFTYHSENKEVPDIILCSWPTPEFACAAVAYGKKHHIPVIVDARDCWPDIFYRPFPQKIQWFVKICLLPMKVTAHRTFKGASGISGMSPASVKWGCRYAGRKPGKWDQCIFIGSSRIDMSNDVMSDAFQQWRELGVTNESWNICIISTMGQHLDLKTLILAVKKLIEQGINIKLVVGGDGDLKEYYQNIAGSTERIVFAGWLNEIQMNSLMKLSRCGAYSMKNTEDFINTFSNKAIQYLSAGLPILNSLKGYAKTYLREKKLGVTYEEGNVMDCVEKIMELYSDDTLCCQISENAIREFEDFFESSRVNRQFEEYLQGFIGT